jgi:hypothetical protein
MFKQFSTLIHGNEVYLISSMGIFVLFFLIVGIAILLMKKETIAYMSELPLTENENNHE